MKPQWLVNVLVVFKPFGVFLGYMGMWSVGELAE